MNPKKVHLLNAARKALFQRAQLGRTLGGARQQFAPAALKRRGARNVNDRIDSGVAAAEAGLRKYRLPLGLAALAGFAFAFRRPIKDAANNIAAFLERQNADAAAAPSPHQRSKMMSQFDDLKQSSLDTAAAAKARITETYGKAKAATSDAAAKASEQVHQLSEKAAPVIARGKAEAAKVGSKLKDVAEKQPLTLLAGAVAVGALLGSLLPKGKDRDA